MRAFLTTVVWFANFGNFIQTLVITSALWILYNSGYSVLVIAPIKFIAGSIIGWWAYSVARKMPVGPAYT
jgi:hypothetical protein